MPSRLERFQGCLMGVRVGDALGMPFEILTREQIAAITDRWGVATFWDPQQHRSDAPRWAKKLGVLKPGDFTDDWQMTRAGAQSLLQCGGLNLSDLAQRYIEEHRIQALGWGGTTARSVRAMEAWFWSKGREGRAPERFAVFPPRAKPGSGCGNGVAMRIAPFALWTSGELKDSERASENIARWASSMGMFSQVSPSREAILSFQQTIWRVGGMTHPDVRATIAAYAVASIIARLAGRDGKPLTRPALINLVSQVRAQIRFMEENLPADAPRGPETPSVSQQLRLVVPSLVSVNPAVEIAKRLGTSSFALESVPFAIATFLRHPLDFRAALKEAVEAGGDTDTNAAIVGSMVGANVGVGAIPDGWRRFRPDFQQAEDLGAALYDACHTLPAD